MAQTKNEVARSVSDQESIVKRIVESNRPKPTKRYIPGGKTLLDQIDKDTLKQALFTWLKTHRWFEWVRISFADDISKMNLEVTKIEDFPIIAGKSVWEQPAQGRRWLAQRFADQLLAGQYVYVEARKDGLYVAKELGDTDFGPDSDNWEPNIQMLPIRRGTYST